MHAGWRQYLKQRLKTPSKFYSVGLEFSDDSIQVSVLLNDKNNITWVKQHLLPTHDWQKHLQNYISQESLSNTPCHVVLGPNSYQIQQIEKPQVPDDELAQALVWTVKDLMPNQDDIIIDYFDLPVQSAGANKINVVALPKDKVEELTDGILDVGLDLKSIGILELIVADLVDANDDAVLTLVQESGQEICLNIIKQGQVYFSRRLRGYENLPTFSEDELQMGVGDNLSVEIQRSMDYFESQLRQAPVKKILLAIESPHIEKLAQMMQQLTFLTVEAFHIDVPHSEELTYRSSFIGSLGAALVQKSGMINEK